MLNLNGVELLAVGNVVFFTYNGKGRKVKVEKRKANDYITGVDENIGAYRTFRLHDIVGPVTLQPIG